MKWGLIVSKPSRARFLATPWTAAYQAPLSMGFSRQQYWSGICAFNKFWSFCWWRVLPQCWWLQPDQGYLLKVGCLWQFLKISVEVGCIRSTLLFMNDFSVAGNATWEHFTHSSSFKIRVKTHKPLLLHQLSWCNILSPLLSFQQSSQHLHQ